MIVLNYSAFAILIKQYAERLTFGVQFYIFTASKHDPMKKIPTLLAAAAVMLLFYGCPKNEDASPEEGTFTVKTYTNPTDPALMQLTYEDGIMITYSGTRDANGFPVSIQNVKVNFPDEPGDFVINLDEKMLPVKQLTPNGTVFEYLWNNDSTLRLTAISPTGEVQVSIPVDLKTMQPVYTPESPGPLPNIRKGMEAGMTFTPYVAGPGTPLKPASGNAMIFHVQKCGVDVSNAIVVMTVTPALGVTTFPCTYIGNGFYSTNIPMAGEPPANYMEECNKVGQVVTDVCNDYNLYSLGGSVPASVLCPLLSGEIAKVFPNVKDGEKIKAMCSKSIDAIGAICKWAKDKDIAKLCQWAVFLNSEPKGGYSFTVSVTVPGQGAYTPGAQGFDPNNPQTYMVDMGGSFDISNLRTIPPDPAPKQGYTAYADIICPEPGGTSVTISIVGSDGYSNSFTQSFTTNGTISLYVPGGAESVRDVVTVAGKGITKNISIIF